MFLEALVSCARLTHSLLLGEEKGLLPSLRPNAQPSLPVLRSVGTNRKVGPWEAFLEGVAFELGVEMCVGV